MQITKLEYQKKDKDRVNIFVDDNFFAGIGVNDILTFNLYAGKEISQEEINKIVAQSEFGKMLNFAINYLSFRPRSQWEIETHLKRKFNKVNINITEKLKKLGLIDDLKFAQWFVEQRNTFRPKGKRMLGFELKRLGVSNEIAKNVLGEDKTSDFEKAYGLISKKKFKDKEKIIRFLGARGFNWDTIKEVLARLKIIDYNLDSCVV